MSHSKGSHADTHKLCDKLSDTHKLCAVTHKSIYVYQHLQVFGAKRDCET